MKHIFIPLLLILAACSKSSNGPVTPPDTILQVKLINETTGAFASGATVKLYISLADYQANTNSIATQTADASGTVKFTGLQSKVYHWYASDGCCDNTFTTNATSAAIPSGSLTVMNSSIASTGTLKFVNNSSHPYQVSVNGVVAIASQASGTTYQAKRPAGAYTIRVLQLSGYVITPTDQTYTGTLTCGATLTTTYP